MNAVNYTIIVGETTLENALNLAKGPAQRDLISGKVPLEGPRATAFGMATRSREALFARLRAAGITVGQTVSHVDGGMRLVLGGEIDGRIVYAV